METIIFGRWWRNHQSLAHKSLRIFRFCVTPWKDAPEPTIKNCLGRQVDVVQEFITIQNFGHNWWWANGIRVEYFHRMHTLQRCNKVQECMSKMSDPPEQFQGRIIFMSMFNDIAWWSEDNEQECESNANLVSISARRFSPGRWSFLGPGSEKKWYSTRGSRPQREWDRVAELMMIKFGESGHPQFSEPRVHLSRGTLKTKWGGNCLYTSVPMGNRLKLFFAQLFLLISSVSTEQSQMCVRNTKPAK